ncbi:MAG: GIY-YIG nuclease family protein [Cyclobacteriaceae bacterium]|nr:GIY-YIG nuclease family protein [Cyclobacteriaceae bacterium]
MPAGATNSFFVYVIKSLVSDFLYKGHCQDLARRIDQHNSGMTKSLRPYLPFTLIYFEELPTRKDAVERERYFKSSAGRRFLKKKLAPYFNARPTEPGKSEE